MSLVMKLVHLRLCKSFFMFGIAFLTILSWSVVWCFYLSNVKCLCVFSVTLYLPWLVCDASSITFPCIHTLASCISFRYARCTPWRTWCGANPKRVLVDLSQKWKEPTSARMGDAHQASSSDKHWLESDPKQAPKHYKPPTFKAINSIYVISIVALSGRSCLETLAALYHSLFRDMNPWILHRPGSSRCLVLCYMVEVRWFPITCEL
jgi:hypothetical protein